MVGKKIYIGIACSLIALGFFVFIGIKIRNGFSALDDSFSEDLPSSYSIPIETSNLIPQKYIHELKANIILKRRHRNPSSLIYFGNQYHLIIYKIDLIKNGVLKDILQTSTESVDRTTGETYTDLTYNNFFKFQYHDVPGTLASQIYLTLAGDSLQNIVKNDSMISYHLLCDNLSIRYGKKDPVDILLVGVEKGFGATVVIPADILVLKRDSAIYLMIMTPNREGSTIAPNLLYNIVMENG